MSELISGKEALIALANGGEVEYANSSLGCIRTNWLPVHSYQWSVSDIKTQSSESNGGECRFRLKPRTIAINGVDIPAPFEPKDGELFYYINNSADAGYSESRTTKWSKYLQFGAWRTEEEIKQVVAALRKVFNPSN